MSEWEKENLIAVFSKGTKAKTCQKSHNYSRCDVTWARGRATRRERRRQRAELDAPTAAETAEPALIHLQPRSAHCCTAGGSPAPPPEAAVVTFMYVLSSGILPSAISFLLPMKIFPEQKHVNKSAKREENGPRLRRVIRAPHPSHHTAAVVRDV